MLRAHNVATFMSRMSRNPGSFNLLQPSRPVHACIRIECTILTSIFVRKLRASENIRIWNSNVHFRITSIYQQTNAHIISHKTLLKHFKTLRHVSFLSDHHHGA